VKSANRLKITQGRAGAVLRWSPHSRDGSENYAGFMSYSHDGDRLFAVHLQAGVENFAKPWNQMRAVTLFRDDASLTATPGLWSAIEAALSRSSWFVLLASPEAATYSAENLSSDARAYRMHDGRPRPDCARMADVRRNNHSAEPQLSSLKERSRVGGDEGPAGQRNTSTTRIAACADVMQTASYCHDESSSGQADDTHRR
jgi:hypothetical protein